MVAAPAPCTGSIDAWRSAHRHLRRHFRSDPLRPSAARAGARRVDRSSTKCGSCPAARRRIAQRRRSPPSSGSTWCAWPLGDNPLFKVDDREVRRSGPGYTVDTLTEAAARARRRAAACACCSAPMHFSSSRRGTAGTNCLRSRTSSSRTARVSARVVAGAHARAARARICGAAHAPAVRGASVARRRHRDAVRSPRSTFRRR